MINKHICAGLATIGLVLAGSSFTAMAESGQASWYSSGGGYTAAHRTLPFGTGVRVTNNRNRRSGLKAVALAVSRLRLSAEVATAGAAIGN